LKYEYGLEFKEKYFEKDLAYLYNKALKKKERDKNNTIKSKNTEISLLKKKIQQLENRADKKENTINRIKHLLKFNKIKQ